MAMIATEKVEIFGKGVFGKGVMYRLIEKTEISDVGKLSDDEKANGISTKMNSEIYVPYDKGDKDGNRWYL